MEAFKSLVLTYKNAPLDVREKVSLNEDGTKQLLRFIKNYTQATDVLVISTCNRTEIYYQNETDCSSAIFNGLKLVKGIDSAERIEDYFLKLEHRESLHHLFEVSIGLDAQVLGDLQISGQVKNAYQYSADEDMAGPFLHRLMHTVFYVNKRVVQETAFRDGAASISYAAKELAEDLTQTLVSPKALVLGIGEIGQDVCLNLVSSKFKDVNLLNRTEEKARQLAEKCGFNYRPIENLKEAIAEADVVISSVAGKAPIITKALLSEVGILSHKYFIDLSIPRSIAPETEEIPGVILYNIDDLRGITQVAIEKRKSSIPDVNAIIQEAIDSFEDWSKEAFVSPTIQKLKNALEQIRREEVARYLKNANASEAAALDELSRNLVQKFMKLPVLQLKAACKRGDASSLVEVLNQLFDLENVPAKKG